jgi:ABC-type cobalt transport system substrate-binding protein
MAMNICIQKQSTIVLLIELGKFVLLVVLVAIVVDDYFSGADGGTSLRMLYVLSMEACP